MGKDRFCVFCGAAPEEKNREHILPQWLLQMTGDPKRVVNFGINYATGNVVKFDWSSFVVPACAKCNTEYSSMEGRAKGYVERLLQRESLTSTEYMDFMDWLDKVRVGVWIAYHFIQGNPTNIKPMLHINTRISKKDRMIAIYSITTDEDGLNVFGAESLVFHRSPCCFGLRINSILIMNMSSDYLFSARCWLPYPRHCETWLDGDNAHMMSVSDFYISRKIKHPLIRKTIIKPSIHLYQPIMLKDYSGEFQSGFLGVHNKFDHFLDQHTIGPYPTGKGILFFQHLDKVEPIYDLEAPVEFQNVTGIHSKPMYELVSQVYEFQNFIYSSYKYCSSNPGLLKAHQLESKIWMKDNSRIIAHYKSMAKEHV